jgi:hypothetical protein
VISDATSQLQTITNSRALLAAAAKLENTGWTGDSFRFVEGLVLSVLADGFRPLDPPVPTQGAGSTEAARRDALAIAEAAVRAAKEKGGRL